MPPAPVYIIRKLFRVILRRRGSWVGNLIFFGNKSMIAVDGSFSLSLYIYIRRRFAAAVQRFPAERFPLFPAASTAAPYIITGLILVPYFPYWGGGSFLPSCQEAEHDRRYGGEKKKEKRKKGGLNLQ